MRLYLVRHGQTSWNAQEKAQGHTDICLDEEGLEQAQMLGSAFQGVTLDLVLSSDLQRARETARPIASATNCRLETEPLLRERGFGVWEGKSFAEFRKHLPQTDSLDEMFNFVTPGGESFADVWERLQPVVQRLLETNQDLAVVTHGGTCALLLAQLLRADFGTSRSFRFGNAAIVELERKPDGYFTLLRYNDTSHLRSPVMSGGLEGTVR